MSRSQRHRSGLSLVEVAFAMAVLALLMIGLAATTTGSVHLSELAQERRLALNKADAVLARLLADRTLKSTWSDALTGDPKPNVPGAKLATGATGYVYDFGANLGEYLNVTVPELYQATGTFTIDAFRVDPIVQWTAPSAGPPFAPAPAFAWNAGHFYRLKVSIRWLPAIARRRGQGNMPPSTVNVESTYYNPE